MTMCPCRYCDVSEEKKFSECADFERNAKQCEEFRSWEREEAILDDWQACNCEYRGE